MSVLNPSNPLRRSGGGGQDGMSAYEIALANGFVGTEQEWLNSLVGPDGSQGPIGPEGKSAYEIAVKNGFEGTEQEWLASLIGPEGTEGPQGPQGFDGPQGNPGADGQDGISPTVSISAIEGGHELKITDAIGEQSFNVMNGQEGKSAYEIAVENGFEGSEWDWLNSLVGPEGQQGIPGDQGPQGIQGVDGAQGIPGPQGEAFSIAKVYSSVEEMNSDFGNSEIKEGQFVLINTDDVEDEDNAKLFVKTPISFSFVTDLSGAQGMRGPQGIQGIQGQQGLQGIPGTPGADGQNGISPIVSVTEIEGGHRITVSDANGTQTFDVLDGADGMSDFPTIRNTAINNISFLDKSVNNDLPFTIPCCIRLINSSLGYTFEDDIVHVSRDYNGRVVVTTLDNAIAIFNVDETTGGLELVMSDRLENRLVTIEEDIEELKEAVTNGGAGVTTVPVKAPIGCIVWWSGTVTNIPTGWHICDGTGETVDLRDKFILAAGTNHAVGDTGGSEEVTLTVDQMPTHNHGIDTNIGRFFEGTNSAYMLGITGDTSSTNNAGSSQPHPNMPPYYTLIAIQKIAADETDTAEISFDDTIVQNNGVYSVANPNRGILTQAEYDALSEEQKINGTYVISDGGESGGGSGVTFIPFVSEDGTLSWTNDGGLENPTPVNIKGTAGKDGNDGLTVEESTSTSGNGTWHIRKHSDGYLELALHAEETCEITRQYGTNNSAFIPPAGTRFRYSYPGIGKPIEIYSENITVTSTSDDIVSFMSCGSGSSSFTSMIYPFSFISRTSETLHINIFVTGRWK